MLRECLGVALNARQAKFAAVYRGNATQAAREAGYTGNDAVLAEQGRRLLGKSEIAAAIAARTTAEMRPAIASREEVEAFLTRTVREGSTKEALEATKQLAKMSGWNLQRVEVTGKVTLEQLLAEAAPKP